MTILCGCFYIYSVYDNTPTCNIEVLFHIIIIVLLCHSHIQFLV